MAYKFQFRDVFAQQDAILDGLVLTLQLSVGTITLGFVLGVLVAAALPLAALRSGVVRPGAGETVCLIVCGANLDPASLN